jgi:hypothetical protein
MGRMSRDKGKRGELEACEALKDVWPGLERTYHQARKGSDAPDVDGPGCPVWLEVKRTERINIHQAMEQAKQAAYDGSNANAVVVDGFLVPRPPVIVHRRSRGEWLVTMRASDLKRVVGR